ncbi:MAG: hypothetical protein EOO88_31765, partial [Pedobacter sp.]
MQHRIINLSQEIDTAEGQPVTQLSFKPFLDYVRLRLKDKETIKREIYQLILQKFERFPELEHAVDLKDLGKYKELLNLLYMVLSSVVDDEKTARWALSTPVTPQLFFGTDAMYDFMLVAGTQKMKSDLVHDKETIRRQKCEKIYSMLLHKFYHFNFNSTIEIVREVFDKEAQLQKYYRFNLDTRFIEV